MSRTHLTNKWKKLEGLVGELRQNCDDHLAQMAALDRSLGKFRVGGLATTSSKAKRPDRSRKEATMTEKRQYYTDFTKAKEAEYKSWVDNDVFEHKV